jgi:hypothetical protein
MGQNINWYINFLIQNNLSKSIKSTLCSSGIFQKIDEENKLWYFKEADALHYLKRTTEKTLSRKKKEPEIDEEKEIEKDLQKKK